MVFHLHIRVQWSLWSPRKKLIQVIIQTIALSVYSIATYHYQKQALLLSGLHYYLLLNIYSALIDSIFDYSFFTVAVISESTFGFIQRVQNWALRCIFRLNWVMDSHYGPRQRDVYSLVPLYLPYGACTIWYQFSSKSLFYTYIYFLY